MTAPSDRSACPYVGLEPFQESDHEFFKGRERDQRIIIANLLSSPLTILYGAAGVGKSSLLLAGVVPQLHDERPRTPVIVFRDWKSANFQERLAHACIEDTWNRGTSQPKPSGTLPLDEILRACSEAVHGTVVLMLDQFEVYLLHHPKSNDANSFEAQLARAINRDDVDVGILISVREASLSKLDRFRERIPSLFSNTLRLNHLDRAGAEAAIGQSVLDVWNRKYSADDPVTIEAALVEAVIDQVHGLSFGRRGGLGVAATEVAKIEAPFLQLVMTRLWDEEIKTSRVLRLETLQRLGGAEQIVCAHLGEVMVQLDADGQAICASFFDRLVTPSGSKVPCSAADLARWADSGAAQVPAILDLLSARRILRTIESEPEHPEDVRYEIFHDVLAPAILEWHDRYVEERQRTQAVAKERERMRNLRRRVYLLGASSLVAVVSVLAFQAWLHATEARANQKATESMALARTDGRRALDLALAAAAPTLPGPKWLPRGWLEEKVGASPTVENALRVALQASRLEWRTRTDNQVMSVAFHSSGTLLAVGSRRLDPDVSTVEIWDIASGGPTSPKTRRFPNSNNVGGVAFLSAYDAEAQRVLAAVGNSVLSWTLDSDGQPREFPQGLPISTAFAVSADGTRLATAGGRHEGDEHRAANVKQRSIKIWNLRSGASVRRCVEPAHSSSETVIDVGGAWVLGLAFSPDGCFIASTAVERGSNETYAAIWNAGSGKKMLDLPIRTDSDAVAFDPAGKFLVVGDRQGLAQILRPAGIELDVALKQIAAGGGSRSVQWSVDPLAGHLERIRHVAVSGDGSRIATASGDRTIKIWHSVSGVNLLTLAGHGSYVESVDFSPDGHHLVSGSTDRSVRMWNIASHTDGVYDIAFHPSDPNVFATASRDRTAILWDLSSVIPTPRHVLRGHADSIYRLAFDPKRERIATASFDRSTILWDVTTGARLHEFCKHRDQLRAVAFSPDGTHLATASADGTAHLYELSEIESEPDLECANTKIVSHKENVQSKVQALAVAFHPDPNKAEWITGGSDGQLKLWDFDGNLRGSIPRAPQYSKASPSVVDVAFSGGDEVAALVGSSVFLWSMSSFGERGATPKQRIIVPASAACSALSYDSTNTHLAISCNDGVVYIYDASTLSKIKEIRVHDKETSASFSSDGRWIATASLDRTFHVSPLSFDELRELARNAAKRSEQ